jgi:lipid-A-disaccharide synthase
MTAIPILLSAGEASGDMYAARLATALQQRLDVKIFGMGGEQMRAASVDIITDYHEVSVLGITEVIRHLPSLIRAMRRLVSAAQQKKPTLAILTDFPGFHLRLARKLLPLGVRNVYYICPQFWAWRPWRANLLRRRFVQALCIFPFEEDFFRERGVNAKFIGHPLVGTVQPTLSREQFAAKHNLAPRHPIITLLPGSRWGEISRHLPTMLEACRELERLAPGTYNFVLAVAPGIDLARLRSFIRDSSPPAIDRKSVV